MQARDFVLEGRGEGHFRRVSFEAEPPVLRHRGGFSPVALCG